MGCHGGKHSIRSNLLPMFSFYQFFSKRLWLFSKENLEKLDNEDKLIIKGNNIYRKLFLTENQGQVVETINTNDNEVRVDVSAFNNGMYFINVIDNNGEMTTSKVSVLH